MRILTSGVFQKNTLRKIALVTVAVAAVAFCSPVQAQSKVVDKANELYKNNQFADAAELYRQALQEMENSGKQGRNTILLKSKLAYCYRMNNKMDKAEALYAEVVKDESAKSDTYYYYGEALMSNGKYAEAKKWFTDYQNLEPSDEKAILMLRACDYAPLIEPYFQYLDIQEFAYNSPADDNAPILVKNGLIFSSDRQQGAKLLKEKSGWTGRDYLNLYFAPRKSDGSFGEPGQYSSKLSEVNKNTGNASLTADESEIFFTRNDNVLNKQNTYSLQLFSAKSAGENRWKDVQKLPFCSSNHNFMHPAVSPDGKRLFFASNRAGGFGGTDLWMSERNAAGGEWSKPVNLGPAVNTTVNEGFPFVAADNKLYFCSKGHPGYGGFDIFVTYMDENGAWQPATNLGKPINSPLDDISIFVAPDQRSGYFTSSRSGGDDDIFSFTVLDEAPLAVVSPPAPTNEVRPSSPAAAEPALVMSEEVAEVVPLTPRTVVPEPSVIEEEEAPVLPPVKEVAAIPEPEPIPPVAIESARVTDVPKQISQPVENVEVPTLTEKQANTPTVEIPVVQIRVEMPVAQHQAPTSNPTTEMAQLDGFMDFSRKLEEGKLLVGERFRLDGAVFDPAVWQLTPRITGPLDKLISQLKIYPTVQVEISSHTESLGDDKENQQISANRAATILDYMLREGIAKERILAKGCGETMPVNHCRNGTPCSIDEHLVNQRIEVKVLALDGKW